MTVSFRAVSNAYGNASKTLREALWSARSSLPLLPRKLACGPADAEALPVTTPALKYGATLLNQEGRRVRGHTFSHGWLAMGYFMPPLRSSKVNAFGFLRDCDFFNFGRILAAKPCICNIDFCQYSK
jgi:hypothetical protein